MKSFQYVIQDELGLHARPAGMLVKEAKKFDSTVEIKKGEKTVTATQLILLMTMGVKQGEEVQVEVSGSDEEAAFEAMKTFFETNL